MEIAKSITKMEHRLSFLTMFYKLFEIANEIQIPKCFDNFEESWSYLKTLVNNILNNV